VLARFANWLWRKERNPWTPMAEGLNLPDFKIEFEYEGLINIALVLKRKEKEDKIKKIKVITGKQRCAASVSENGVVKAFKKDIDKELKIKRKREQKALEKAEKQKGKNLNK